MKVHTVIRANEGVPSDVKFTSAATNDSFMLEIAGCQASFNRSNRSSIDRIKSLTIPNVPLETQNKVMAEVEEYESIILEATSKMSGFAEQKEQILKKYIL